MLGGGTFITQNKVLPGAYFNFISKATASANLSDRGIVGMGLALKWGADGVIFDVTAGDFQKNSLKIFGYPYDAKEMKELRDLFLNCKTLHVYKLTSGGEKAANDFATALYGGTRGNDIKTVIATNVDDENAYDVSTYLGTTLVDKQTVKTASELVANDYVVFKTDITLTITAGTSMTGGTDGTADATAHQAFLNKIEAYSDTNIIAYDGTEDTIKALYASFAKRMRDEVGIKLQAVLYNKASDSVAVINVKNKCTESEAALVYWVAGKEAGTPVNKSATNDTYDGEFTVDVNYTQKQLEAAIKAGEFVLHQVGSEIRVLEDINSFVSVTDEAGEVFQDNQTVRIIDMIATSVANIFVSKYLGKVPNNESGRISLWSDIVKIHQELADIQALENFESGDITVAQGDSKKAVVVDSAITVVNAMTKIYMHTVVA